MTTLESAREALTKHDQPRCGKPIYGVCALEPNHSQSNCSGRVTEAPAVYEHLRAALAEIDRLNLLLHDGYPVRS